MTMTLSEQFADLAIKIWDYLDKADARSSNKAGAALRKVVKKMRAQPDQGYEELLKLVRHPDPAVALEAADYLLPLDEETAKRVLRILEPRMGDLIGFSAGMMLKEWESNKEKLRDSLMNIK